MREKEENNRIFYNLGKIVLAAGVIFLTVLAIRGTDWLLARPSCIFFRTVGWYCPGCGGTRAFVALMRGNILESLRYHPVVFYGLTVFLWFMAAGFINKHGILKDIYVPDLLKWIYGGIGLLLGQWIIKNVLLYLGR